MISIYKSKIEDIWKLTLDKDELKELFASLTLGNTIILDLPDFKLSLKVTNSLNISSSKITIEPEELC